MEQLSSERNDPSRGDDNWLEVVSESFSRNEIVNRTRNSSSSRDGNTYRRDKILRRRERARIFKRDLVTFIRDLYNHVCTIRTLPPLRCASSRWIIMISDNKIFCIFNGRRVAFALLNPPAMLNGHNQPRRSVVGSAFHLLSRRVYTSVAASRRRFHRNTHVKIRAQTFRVDWMPRRVEKLVLPFHC